MKQKVLQVITAILLIITLTMANFLFLCVNVVSYAAEQVSIDKKTNHKNVEFMAYFEDSNGGKVDKIDALTNNDDLKLYLRVAVNQEGYFKGDIELKDVNFRIKDGNAGKEIEKIEDNKIYLNQINAGESKEIELKIEMIKDTEFDLNLIDKKSNIVLKGTYKDSTQKDISINSEKTVKMRYKNPYVGSKVEVNLSQEINTNKVLNINGEEKRVIQLQVESLINNDIFPIKKSSIDIYAPKISDKYPEKVFVNSFGTLLTNGKELKEEDWKYDEKTGIINIALENSAVNNKVSWLKNGEDKFIITYIYDKDVELNNESLQAKTKTEYYDLNQYEIERSNKTTLTGDGKQLIANDNLIQGETSIYKGKLYAGIERKITYKNIVDFNLSGVVGEINITEENQKINDKEINATYETSKINKNKVEKLLGESGELQIINADDKSVITIINKESQSDENGNIVINYPENVKSIIIKTQDIENIGRIEIETTKSIKKVEFEELEKADKISQVNVVTCKIDDEEKTLEKITSSIELKETETFANLEINRKELSTMNKNENVEFRVVLNSKDEKNELFKNPIVKLELPEKIEKIEVNSIDLLYEDEMKVKKATLDGNTIVIELDGEQTKYKYEAIEGAIIIINANLTVNMKNPSSKEQVKLQYTNENAINYVGGSNEGIIYKDINIVSYAGIVTTNQIPEYGIEVVNNEGTKTGKIEISDKEKNATVVNKIVNNNENKISDVRILGILPTNDSTKNNIDIKVSNIVVEGIDSNKVKIYVSNNSEATENLNDSKNAWNENINNLQKAKKYLVVITELDVLKEMYVKYQITVPANLEYNKSAEEGFNVYYKDAVTGVANNTKLDNVKLSTGKGPIVETSLKLFVGEDEKTTVSEGDILTYQATISNTGTEEVIGLKLIGNIPENTVYVEKNQQIGMTLEDIKYEPYKEFADKQRVEFDIEKLSVGETITKTFQVKVKDSSAGKNIKNIVMVKYGEITKKSNEVINNVEKAELQTILYDGDSANGKLKQGYSYRYVLKITNKTDKEKNNIMVSANVDKNVLIKEIYYSDGKEKFENVNDTDNFIIDSIKPNETISVTFLVEANPVSNKEESKGVIYATVNDGSTKYTSNVENIETDIINVETKISSNKENQYISSGDELEYSIIIKNNAEDYVNNIFVISEISDKVTLTNILKDNKELSLDGYSKGGKATLKLETLLNAGTQTEYKIKVVANRIPDSTKSSEITNNFVIKVGEMEIANKDIKNVLKPEVTSSNNNVNQNTDGENKETTNNKGEYVNSEKEIKNNKKDLKSISGYIWNDINLNGKKDSGEEGIKDVKVKLLDSKTNKFVKDSNNNDIQATTDENGFYSFDSIQNGEYIVIFEYDTSKYVLAKYRADSSDETNNSKVINKTMTIDGKNYTVGATEIIKLISDNIANINMGLTIAKNADLKLDKYVSKVIVQNSKGTVTDEYENTKFAKTEIDAKLVNSTTAVVEYTIKITNVGEVDAYASKIADYLSKDYKFTSELNKDWYQSGDTLYNNSLSNEKIAPGQSKEVKLTVTKQMKDSNTGLINNTAEIVESHNDLGLTDSNENNKNSADLIISIKTGQVITTAAIVITTIVIIGVATYIVAGYVLRKKVF